MLYVLPLYGGLLMYCHIRFIVVALHCGLIFYFGGFDEASSLK